MSRYLGRWRFHRIGVNELERNLVCRRCERGWTFDGGEWAPAFTGENVGWYREEGRRSAQGELPPRVVARVLAAWITDKERLPAARARELADLAKGDPTGFMRAVRGEAGSGVS